MTDTLREPRRSAASESVPLVFFDGSYMPYDAVRVGLLTQALNYGTGCFEGIRAYWQAAASQLYLVEPRAHYQRMRGSANILGLSLPYSADELVEFTAELLRRNGYREDVYVRPLLYAADETIMCALTGVTARLAISAVPFGDYVPIDRGLRCVVSTWRRVPDVVAPARAKVCGVYVMSALAKSEALAAGCDEAITLTVDGKVSEGSGENLFIFRHGAFATPPVTADILEGVTRLCLMRLIRDELGLPVIERMIDRTELYCADEVLLCGTGAQVAGVVEVDGRPVGDGRVGALARRLQDLYLQAARGELPRYREWLVPVHGEADG